jgi:hypothetical protein
MFRLVGLVITDVSVKRIATTISVTRISELGTKLAITRNRSTLPEILYYTTLMMVIISSSETSVLTIAIRGNILEDGILHNRRCENVKSYIGNRLMPASLGRYLQPLGRTILESYL